MSTLSGYLNAKNILLVESGRAITPVKGTLASESVIGTFGNDYFMSSAGEDTLYGGAGDDTYMIGNTKDHVVETTGNGTDTAVSYLGFYQLTDNVENLTVGVDKGWGRGNGLDNIIKGGEGSQTLDGGAGNDVLIGGAGVDTFIVRAGNGSDVIQDFQAGLKGDYLRLDNYGFKSFADIKAQATQSGKDTVIKLSADESLILRNTTASSLVADNFRLAVNTDALKLTFTEEFNSFSTYNFTTKTGTWMTNYGVSTNDTINNRTLWSNNERQIYTDTNFKGTGTQSLGLNPFSLANGELTITATSVSDEASAKMWGYDYSSGVITTRKSFAQQYGYFEIKADIPSGQGMWPAFWLLPADGTWPPELDVFESLGNKDTVYQTVHSNIGGNHTSDTTVSHSYPSQSGYHTYGLMWTPKELIWYVDGAEVKRTETPADMHKPMYMIANLAVGGSWPGDPAAGTNVNAQMKIDYIHAYSLETVTPPAPPAPVPTPSPAPPAPGPAPAPTGPFKSMTGTKGNDVFNVTNSKDTIFELANGGSDTARATVSYTLGANVENLNLLGSAALIGTGNDLSNQLIGNNGKSTLYGLGGNDYLVAGTNDTIMYGGAGDDVYTLYNTGDKVIELASQGLDTVRSSVSFTLGDNIENLALKGTGSLTATGNSLDNFLTGNDGKSTLYGLGGNDTLTSGTQKTVMYGGVGNDVYSVSNSTDVVIELANEGVDTVRSTVSFTLSDNVENLSLNGTAHINATGNSANNRVVGNHGNNELFGLGGNDYLLGGKGNDLLSGGAGADVFAFQGGFGHDIITDFSLADKDRLDLSALKAKNTASIHQVGADVVISFIDGSSLTIQHQDMNNQAFKDVISWG